MSEQRVFQIQLEGLIRLLAQNLYADPDVFLREMIQNAHDSVTRRAELARDRAEGAPPAPRISVEVDRAAQEIRIADNGCGLTDAEIDAYLSTIGRSGTNELRERIVAADRNRTVELIGQFGIGLLSAFIVADRVSVVTRAAGHEALRWESDGGREYSVRPGHRENIGTTVILHVRPEHTRYLDSVRIKHIVRTYADFIGVPVYVNDDAQPANAVTAPWHRTYAAEHDRFAAHRDLWDRRFADETALHVVVVDEPFSFPDAEAPGGERTGRIRGVLAVTDRHTPDVNARGTVDVYISRMFVGAANRDVLPAWARFMQGVLECNELTPNAARDSVRHNAALVAVRRTLGDLIVRELTQLSENSHRSFTEIMRWHAHHLLAMAVQPEHERFFRAVADLAVLETDQGPMAVGHYLRTAERRSDGVRIIHYITEEASAKQYMLLAGARGVRVFDCTEAFAERFLKKYAETWPERARLNRLDEAGAEALFEPLDAGEAARFTPLERAYAAMFADRSVTARASRFEPAALPAVLTETREGKRRREMDVLAADAAMPAAIRDIVQDFLAEADEPLILHLNAANPIIRKLAARPSLDDEVGRSALQSLYNNALMLLARTLPADAVHTMFTQSSQVIDLMLGLAEQVAQGSYAEPADAVPAPRQATYLSCSVTLPEGEPRSEEIFAAVRSVLEAKPYYWQVLRADSPSADPDLPPDLDAPPAHAALNVAVFAGPRLNQGLVNEVSISQILGQPQLILCDEGHPALPASFADVPQQTVHGLGAVLRKGVRSGLAEHPEVNRVRAYERYLSPSVLAWCAGLEESVGEAVSRRYPTWSEFQEADSADVARAVDIDVALVEAAKSGLRLLAEED
ncbi:ATP-binding protein [Actinospica sp. MGRD01-02]|uniref:ATP-binding protein n=1 Tax=Actinospica acidithermotolerans TaxID=2828514 RepID=A0A941EG54_9ACTN|nr:ATP-binding protein [Actinospica acidithermotolerans]MBR7829975.1 ATP-binding protein [Actinospica acidithermotolerans]